MPKWRYTAIVVDAGEKDSERGTVSASWRPYAHALASQEQGLEKLPEFMRERVVEFGGDLLAVSLERSESDVPWALPDDLWTEVRRIRPEPTIDTQR